MDNSKLISDQGADREVLQLGNQFLEKTGKYKYTYNFKWMGRPIIQFPQDMVAMQEIIWEMKPDLIVETGIAHGGSLVYYASILELIGGEGEVLGIDIDIRDHNRVEIEKHPMFKRINMLEGSSVDEIIVNQVFKYAEAKKNILVCLDSMHSHSHVLKELEYYSPLVKKNGYLVVYDTAIEDMPIGSYPDRPWDKGDNPKTAVWKFLENNDRFEIDKSIENKLVITVAPDGYLRCIKD